jgi:hypothetical protein
MAEQNPTPDNDQYDPNLEAEDDELSGGSNRLAFIMGGVLLLLILGYILLPKGNGGGLASVTPTFMLDDAAVTGTKPTAADSLAAGLKLTSAPASTAAEATSTRITHPEAGTVVPAAAAAAPVAAAPAEVAAPEPEAAPAAAEPAAPAAPASVSVSGHIDDENGKPLVGATVFLKGSSKATSTDGSGNYSIEVPGGADNTLVYGYGGYQDEVVKAKGSQPVNVTLTPTPGSKKRRR